MKTASHSIDPETLRRWLTEGRKVQVLDIRRATDRAEWFIPGSIHVDAYEALKAGDPAALADVPLRNDVPVVTVCGIGRTASVAAEHLAARGLDAMPLDGGMKAWSIAWNTAEIAVSGDARVVQFRRTGKGCLSYLVASGEEAAVLDASLEPQVYIEAARIHGWRITRVLETHVHADHLSRSRQLAQATGAELHLPEQHRVSFAHTPVREGDLISIGSVALRAMRTPGHTLESTCYLLEHDDAPRTRVAFTGDSLFLAGIGRPDLGANQAGARERAGMLFHSLRRLLNLNPMTLVLPGHHSEPVAFDGKPLAVTLADVRARLPILGEPETVFVRHILSRIPPTPANYERIVQFNEAGAAPEGNPLDLESGANRCAVS